MACLSFVKTFVICFLASAILLSFIARKSAWACANIWKKRSVILFVSAVLGYLPGRMGVRDDLDALLRGVRESKSVGGNAEAYLLGDYLPFYLSIGGSMTPEMRETVERIAAGPGRCRGAMAKRVLGESIDVRRECDEEADEAIAAAEKADARR